MKASEINDWLGVATNVGIIVGLVLVGYEIQQNSIEIERELRASNVEVITGLREGWQNWNLAIVENEEVAELWLRGNTGDSLNEIDALRYRRLAIEMFELTAQNYTHWTINDGASADWAVHQLTKFASQGPGLRDEIVREMDVSSFGNFVARIRELDPSELRVTASTD